MIKINQNNLECCHCGNTLTLENCCKPIISGFEKATSAQQLMRSRYTAFCIQAADYLIQTTHHSTRKFHKKNEILSWSNCNTWLKLEIISFDTTTVEFKAYYLDETHKTKVHHEKSTFILENGNWFYVDGKFY